MTKIDFIHNPFSIKTVLKIDGKGITETSSLHKYLNSPMQDWIGVFFNNLISDCNDDELEVNFVGLEYNFKDLEDALNEFRVKNLECEIELKYENRTTQFDRLIALEQLIDECNGGYLTELKSKADVTFNINKGKELLNILILGGTSNNRKQFMNNLFECNFEHDEENKGYFYVDDDSIDKMTFESQNSLFKNYRFNCDFLDNNCCTAKIYEIPNLNNSDYFGFVEEMIENKDTVVICLFEGEATKYNKQLMDLLYTQYRFKGKRSKWRFIFVADMPLYCKRSLSSEFFIKNASVYAMDEVKAIKNILENYQYEVCLINQIRHQCELIGMNLLRLGEKVSYLHEQEQGASEKAILKLKTLELLKDYEIEYVFTHASSFNKEPLFNIIKSRLASKFVAEVFNQNSTNVAAKNCELFIYNLPKYIAEQLDYVRKEISHKATIKFNPNIYWYLDQLEIDKNVRPYINKCEGKFLREEECLENIIPIYMTKISRKPYVVSNDEKVGATKPWLVSSLILELSASLYGGRVSRELCEALEQQKFYDGLNMHLKYVIERAIKIDGEKIEQCKEIFKRSIDGLRGITFDFMDQCNKKGQEYYKVNNPFEKELHEVEKCIDELVIVDDVNSKYNENDIEYVKQLYERVISVTMIGGGNNHG